MVAEGSGYATGGDGADPGAGEVGAISAEAEAVLGTDRRKADSWDVSRAKCALYGVATPLAIIIPLALVTSGGALTSDATDPAQREFEQAALVLILGVVFGGIALFAVREFVFLTLFGGGLSAAPEGLRFTWGRRTMLFRWDDVTHVAIEGRTTGSRSYKVLAIRFGAGFRWPRAGSLWYSKPTCLCISPLILVDPGATVANEIEAAKDRYAAAGTYAQSHAGAETSTDGIFVYESAILDSEKPGRWIAGTLLGVALVLWAAFCAWGVIEAVAASDLAGVFVRGIMGLITGAIGLALLLKGDVIRKVWDEA